MAGSSTSPIAPYVAVEGLLIQCGTGGSPESMYTVANVSDFSLPVMADMIDVTNVGDSWKRKVPTLHDMGKIAFKVFWVMEEVTHRNTAGSTGVGGVMAGLRYMLINNLLRDWEAIYADGNGSTDAWPGYTTSFAITGKTGGAFEAAVDISNSGSPTLV